MKLTLTIFLAIYICFFISAEISAQYNISSSVFSNGGNISSSDKNQIRSSVGEPLTGKSGSSSNQILSGFWYTEDVITGIEGDNKNALPTQFQLMQNYPNPFNPSTTIKYALPYSSKIKISVFNILGQLVINLVDEVKEAGYYDYRWNAANMASGVYIYTIKAKSLDGNKDFFLAKKMILIK
jgi:Secretion system C-terminal sorting domain